ncbi:hypothetical protein U1Q18_017908 [Sarracenia purpurea var. burkii]
MPAHRNQGPSKVEENVIESPPPPLGEEQVTGASAMAKFQGKMNPKVEGGAFEGEKDEKEGSEDENEESIDKESWDDCEDTTCDEEANSEDEAEEIVVSTKVRSDVDTFLNLTKNCSGVVDVGRVDGSGNMGIQIGDIEVQKVMSNLQQLEMQLLQYG